jgi:hypothetical protein
MIGITLLLLCAIWQADLSAQPGPVHTRSIIIEYFGEQASPLFPTIISDSPSAAELGRQEERKDTKLIYSDTYVLDPHLLITLMSEVRKIPTHEIELQKPYVVFHVVILEDGHREVKILDGDQTFGLLERFKNICGQGPLFDHLVYVQKIIELYEGKHHTT